MFKKFALLIVGFVAYTQAIQLRSGEADAACADSCTYNPLRPAIQLGATLLTNAYLDDFTQTTQVPFVCDLEKLPLNYGVPDTKTAYLQNCNAWVSPYIPKPNGPLGTVVSPTGDLKFWVQTVFDKIEKVKEVTVGSRTQCSQ
jgi:hypothetical protein